MADIQGVNLETLFDLGSPPVISVRTQQYHCQIKTRHSPTKSDDSRSLQPVMYVSKKLQPSEIHLSTLRKNFSSYLDPAETKALHMGKKVHSMH